MLSSCRNVDQFLLGAVEILILIDNDVIVTLKRRTCRIIPQIPQRLRNKFPDQHTPIDPQPIRYALVKSFVYRLHWPPGLLMLKTGPISLERSDAGGHFFLVAKVSKHLQVCDQRRDFKSVD